MTFNPTKKQKSSFLYLVILSAVWFVIGWTFRGWRLGPEIGLINQVRQILLAEYPGDQPATREFTYAAIRGMLRNLDDPHAALLEPDISQRFTDDFAGFSGIVGLIADQKAGAMIVTVVFPGSPADQAGIKPGDEILSVDGVKFSIETSEVEASMLIRGPVGEPAHFLVRRGDEILAFNPVRSERPIVQSKVLEGDIAYIAQYLFTTNASQMVKTSLEELLQQQPKAVIWDLRVNSGGSMDTTQEILSYFIEDGILFTAELKDGEQKQFMASGNSIDPQIPLVLLISEQTYSSAETAAISIHENGRGMLIGTTTFGKGTIQTTLPLIDKSMLHFTIANWLSPSQKWVEGVGVEPDIFVENDENTAEDEVLEFAIDFINQNFVP